MNEQNIKIEFNKTIAHLQKLKPISDIALQKKLDLCQKVATRIEDKFKIMEHRNAYLKSKEHNEAKQGVKKEYFKDGIKRGIHSKNQILGVEKNHKLAQDQLRQTTWRDAKNYYAKNFSVQKKFNDKVQDKVKSIDKGK